MHTHFCITNKDLLKVIERNPNLKKMDVSGLKMSHKVLKQILLCKKLRFDEVGLWSSTAQEVKRTIEKLKKKGIRVKITSTVPHTAFDSN